MIISLTYIGVKRKNQKFQHARPSGQPIYFLFLDSLLPLPYLLKAGRTSKLSKQMELSWFASVRSIYSVWPLKGSVFDTRPDLLWRCIANDMKNSHTKNNNKYVQIYIVRYEGSNCVCGKLGFRLWDNNVEYWTINHLNHWMCTSFTYNECNHYFIFEA